jgi:hypothetical protein
MAAATHRTTTTTARKALEELLEKHAVPAEKDGERRWECDFWQSHDGVHIGTAAFIRSRSPTVWVRATLQGAQNRDSLERALLATLKHLVGAGS